MKGVNIVTNRIVLFMTDTRLHIDTINTSIQNNILTKSLVVGAVTNKKSTHLFLKNTTDIPVIYSKWNKNEQSREAYDINLAKIIAPLKPDTVILTGWKHIFTSDFIKSFKNVINIHPALPDSYIGLNCIDKALQEYKKDNTKNVTGLMIHRVIEELDRGPVLEYIEVPIFEYDDLDDLTERFREYERGPLIASIKTIENQ